jgi:transposase
MPGVGPITAMAIETFAPPMEVFKRGRDFAAWLGLVPRQHTTGGRQRLGRTSKMGQRDIRRLLIVGAMAVVRWAIRKGVPENVAPSHTGAQAAPARSDCARQHSVWAMMTKAEDYRVPVVAAA